MCLKNHDVCTAKLVGTRTTRANQAKHKHHQEDRWLEFTTCGPIEASFHHTDRGKHVCSFHQSLKRTTKRPGLQQLEERGREAIGADPELTEDHEEDTEGHPGVGELDLIVGGHAPGEVRKTHHVSAHAPFMEMAATSCGMPVDISKLLIHQPTQLLKAFLCDTAVSLGTRPSLIDRLSSTAALFL